MRWTLLAIGVSLTASVGAEPMMKERLHPPDPPQSSAPPVPMTERGPAPTDSLNGRSARKQVISAEADPNEPVDAAAPRFQVEQTLTEKDPSRFASRLSTLIGVDVRFELTGSRTLTLEAKEWTAVEALGHIAKQSQCSWTVEFRLSPMTVSSKTPPQLAKRLLPLGNVTLGAPHISLAKALRATAERAGCRALVPNDMPFTRLRFSFRETPIDRAMAELAGKVRFTAKPTVVFEHSDTVNLRVERAESERESERVALKGDVSAYLTESYGHHPGDDEFPWDNIDIDDLSLSLSVRLDVTPEVAGDLLTEVRGEALALRGVLQPEESAEFQARG